MSPAAAAKPTLFLVEQDTAHQVDLTREPNTRGCELCGTPIGVVETVIPGGTVRSWTSFFEVTGPDDEAPTRLCARCWDWLGDISPLL